MNIHPVAPLNANNAEFYLQIRLAKHWLSRGPRQARRIQLIGFIGAASSEILRLVRKGKA